jgi:Domain of unknown function (DUF4331)
MKINLQRFSKLLSQATLIALATMGMTSLTITIAPTVSQASDHDDGETSTKGRNVNLTDLYVFRERDQNASVQGDDLVFIMNTNPRSLARQQYFFSNNAQYKFHVTHVANKDGIPTGKEDVVFQFEFDNPRANQRNQQSFRMTVLRNGRAIGAGKGITTPLAANPQTAPTVNSIGIAGSRVDVFAGLREDPFFFDVEQFFRVRAGAAGIGPAVGFRPANTAVDFASGYNVNAIVVRVPKRLLQQGTRTDVFDVWETISTRDPRTGRFTQVERLGRPGVNEGLILTNDLLNAFNSVPPSQDRAPIAAPVREEAKAALRALGNSPARTEALLNAFLPDVMRIDTTQRSGYLSGLNAQGAPITGRLLLDDTIDQTLTVLTNGAITTDNVSYNGTPGNPSQGHKPLAPQFPYLALPN